MKFRPLVAVLASALCVAVSACTPPAAPPAPSTIDVEYGIGQENRGDTPRCGGAVAQTFTAGRTGLLDKVTLTFSRVAPVGVSARVEITTLDGMGWPTSNVLGSWSIGPVDFTTGTQDVELDVPVPVVSGTGYAISVSDPYMCMDQGLSVRRVVPGTYEGGQHLVRPPEQLTWIAVEESDLAFRTWVR